MSNENTATEKTSVRFLVRPCNRRRESDLHYQAHRKRGRSRGHGPQSRNEEGEEGLSIAAGSTEEAFDASVNALGDFGVTESTVIFYLPAAKEVEDYKIASLSMLVDEDEYEATYLDIDDDFNAGVIVITSDSISIADGTGLALVTGSVLATNEEGDKFVRVTFLQNGEEKTLTVDAEAEINEVANFPRGAIFEYSVNAEGFIEAAEFAKAEGVSFAPADVQTAAKAGDVFKTAFDKEDNSKVQYIGGYVVAKNGSTLSLATSYAEDKGARVAIPASANVYVVDVTKTKIVPAIAAIGDVTKVSYKNGELDKNEDTYVVIKYVDKEIVDVIAYKGLVLKVFE